MWKQRGFFDQQNYTKKRTSKERGFFDHRNYTEKRTWKRRGFFFNKVTSKKYVEMTWKFVEIWSSVYRLNVDVELMSIRRDVPIGYFYH